MESVSKTVSVESIRMGLNRQASVSHICVWLLQDASGNRGINLNEPIQTEIFYTYMVLLLIVQWTVGWNITFQKSPRTKIYYVVLPLYIVFSCNQAALWMVFSVRPSVCNTFLTMFPSSYHHEIFRSYYQWQKWRSCKRSRSGVKGQSHTQLSGFRTVTPVWIHIWRWNDAYSLMLLRKGALLFFKVIRQISRSHGSKNCRIWPRLGVSGL